MCTALPCPHRSPLLTDPTEFLLRWDLGTLGGQVGCGAQDLGQKSSAHKAKKKDNAIGS